MLRVLREVLAIPEYLSALGFDCYEKGVAVISVGGKGNIARFWRLFTAFELPVYVIFDNDAGDDPSGKKRTEILQTLGTTEILDVISADDIIIADKYTVFGKDFETSLRKSFEADRYEDIEREAREFMGIAPDNKSDCKPLVARYVASKLALGVTFEKDAWCELERMKMSIDRIMEPTKTSV